SIWSIGCIAGLISAHALFVFPPQTPAELNAYGIAIILLVIGIGLFVSYMQVRRWKQRLFSPAQSPAYRTEEEK
ncbi:MAG TPA: hypothetical protein VFN35_21695, partial [Ktedonobacteraceae bacterium]|nr:hypothetical protein [Ktedonobacteraceae bacterium]